MAGPVRTCVGCRRRAPAGTLVRVARLPDGTLTADRRAQGRGAWLCRDPDTGAIRGDCLRAAVHRDALSRAFRAPVVGGAPPAGNPPANERENM